MKNYIVIIVCLLFCISASAQDRYTDAMKTGIRSIYEAKDQTQLQNAVNSMDRIGGAEKTKWEPWYYSAFGSLQLAIRETSISKKDEYLDVAKAALSKAIALDKNNSEIAAMGGFITMIRVSVNPAERGQQYSMLALNQLREAVQMDRTNPRALALQAQMELGIADFFNQEPIEACKNATAALNLFANDDKRPPLAPRWGKQMTEEIVAKCK